MRTIQFTGFDGEPFILENIPDTADVELLIVKDEKDGQLKNLVVRDGLNVLATFSSVVSFYDTRLKFTKVNGSKDFL